MQFGNDILVKIIILILGVCGFMVSKHIRSHKIKNTPLVCPVGFDCHSVVHSHYSRLFGAPVEILGMIYYALISFAYLFFILFPMSNALSVDISILLSILSLLAFLFSLYLISVQIFILKKGCSWCIVSAIISSLIFILTMFI